MNIWTGLLFLEGAVADVSLAREIAGAAPQPGAQDTAAALTAHDTRTASSPDRAD